MKRSLLLIPLLLAAALSQRADPASSPPAPLPDDPGQLAALLDKYASLDTETRVALLERLSAKLPTARLLMGAVETKKVSAVDFSTPVVLQLRALNDPQINAWIERVWAIIRPSPPAKLAEIAKYKALLTPDALAGADPAAGRAIYAKTCQQCHLLFGVGRKVGPDLTTTPRQDIDYTLSNIIDPSSLIAREFQVTNIWTKDDQILSGVVAREDEASITLITESTSTTVARPEISEMKKSQVSIMPEGQLLPMKPQEVVNLIAYLRSPAQVALPEKK